MDVSTLQDALENLLEYIYMILEARVPESEDPSTEPADKTVMAALFSTYEISSPSIREHAQRSKD